MLIPFWTDSSKYHWPIGTAVLILTNVLLYVGQQAGWLRGWELAIGSGLHPWQWPPCMFMHGSVGHLIGNMLFLWTFGLVLEGRLGTWFFLGLYLASGIVGSLLIQSIFLGAAPGRVVGASGAICSIIAMAMIWMPQDEIHCLYWIFFRLYGTIEVPLLIFVIARIGLDGFEIFLSSQLITTGLLHILGTCIGLATGVILLATKRVNTENRDLWSMFQEARGRELPAPTPTKTKEILEYEQKLHAERTQEIAVRWRSIDLHLAGNNPDEAALCFRRLQVDHPKLDWDESRLIKLISLFSKQGNDDQTIHYSEHYLQRYTQWSATVGLNLAQVYLNRKHAPRRAMDILQSIATSLIQDDDREIARRIRNVAMRKIEAGEIELR